VADGLFAENESQLATFWQMRESITVALKDDGVVYKYDVSLPVPRLYELVELMKERTAGVAITCCGYGHMGDGNLHLNITGPADRPELLGLIEPFVYEFTEQCGGSISAEHGIGLMKATKLRYSKSKNARLLMQQLKETLDPRGILNPYKTVVLD
jgi:D-2-hydroxyglutarate dehydrogenase